MARRPSWVVPENNRWMVPDSRHSSYVLFINWRMVSSGMLYHVSLVRTDVSEEHSASFIRVTRIGKLWTTLAVTSNRRTLRRKNWHFMQFKYLTEHSYVHMNVCRSLFCQLVLTVAFCTLAIKRMFISD
jgi:hypothetical protein